MIALKNILRIANSPWLDSSKANQFRDQFRLIDDLKIDTWLTSCGAYFKPIEIYQWIHDQKGEDLFFKALAQLAPMFPLIAYKGQVALWTSPPPSGFGNAIYMVFGHDKGGQLRVVGGNYFTEPKRTTALPLSDTAFFEKYDLAQEQRRSKLIKDAVESSIPSGCEEILHDIRCESENCHTMTIYITALTESGSLFHVAKAVIEGVKPADFSYEFIGEIK